MRFGDSILLPNISWSHTFVFSKKYMEIEKKSYYVSSTYY